MASVKIAVDFVLKQEDNTLNGQVTTLKGDTGGATRFGIAMTSHPELIAEGFYDATKVSRDAALAIAEQVYNVAYAAKLRVADITDQAVATAVLSFGINAGVPRAGEILQEACVAAGKPVTVDKQVGPGTVAAVNAVDANTMLAQFISKVEGFYTDLAHEHANDARFLKGWIARASAWQNHAAELRSQAV